MSCLYSLEKLGAFGVRKQILLDTGAELFGFPSYEINGYYVVLVPNGITYTPNFMKISFFKLQYTHTHTQSIVTS